MKSWKLWSKPLPKHVINSWVSILDDVVKVGIVALPAVLYGDYSWEFKLFNVVVLSSIIYGILLLNKSMRLYQTGGKRRK